MNSFLIISISCMIILIILLWIIAIIPNKAQESNDKEFINEDGDHVYYDRQLIQYKERLKKKSKKDM